MDKLEKTIELIDRFNAKDPNKEKIGKTEEPKELFYSKRLSEWVARLDSDPSEALRIAARGQHIGRWTIPRTQYPMDRAGYLKWRTELKAFHANKVRELMGEAGYSGRILDDVKNIVFKKEIKKNPDSQTIEDALCLVFLEHQFEELIDKTEEDKMIQILQKTWKKMGPKGREAAMQLELPAKCKAFLMKALSKES